MAATGATIWRNRPPAGRRLRNLRLLLLLAALGLGAWLAWWFKRTPPDQAKKILSRAGLWLGGGLLVGLALTGRLPSLFGLLGAALPFLERLARVLMLWPLIQRMVATLRGGSAAPWANAGQGSEIATPLLRMRLDQDSGRLSGEVLAGRHQGRRLADLSLEQLLQLLDDCGADPASLELLTTYLDRERGSAWRERVAHPGASQEPGFGDPMTKDEALRILGLPPTASEQEILTAHRRLMQKFHPDHGGSNYLAVKINQAKEALLKGPAKSA